MAKLSTSMMLICNSINATAGSAAILLDDFMVKAELQIAWDIVMKHAQKVKEVEDRAPTNQEQES